MNTIFFDLETSDMNCVGQILNFAFVEIDDNWNIKSCIKDKIKISRLQLPSPGAIVANRIDVIAHNKEACDLEHIALAKVQKYIQDIVEWQDTRLVGYNSNKFDVPYLRTNMIRNGLNPYFGGSIKYGDVLHVVKRLACDNPDFYEKLYKKASGAPNFKLEAVAKALGVLDVNIKQDHESFSDVMLTINLAKHLAENYGIDVRTYNSYEVSSDKNFDVVKVFPFVDQNNQKTPDEYCYMALLEQNKTQSLWITLKQFEDGCGRNSIAWYNKNTSSFFVEKFIKDKDFKQKADAARAALSDISLDSFWPNKNCDIEQFIYLMPISQIPSLYDAIWRKDVYLIKQNRSKFASQLYLRFLANTQDIDVIEEQIKKYAVYRYGGKLKLNSDDINTQYEEGVYNENYHQTYNELLADIEKYSAEESNVFLMKQLKSFYDNSIITSLCKDELIKINRTKRNV